MPAGRIHVSCKREVHYFEKESCRYINVYGDSHLSRGRDQFSKRRNGYGFYSGVIGTGGGRNGGERGKEFSGRDRDWELEQISGQGISDEAFAYRSRNGHNSQFEGGVSRHQEKRRKTCPTVRDTDDKLINSSKHGIVAAITPRWSLPSVSQSFGTHFAVDGGDITNGPVRTSQNEDMQISPVKCHMAAEPWGNCEPPVNLPSLLLPEVHGRNDECHGEMEDNESVKVWDISTSRWAYEEDLQGGTCLENPRDVSNGSSSYREGSEGCQGKSSSNGRGSSIEVANEDNFMELGKMHKIVNFSFLDLDIDDEFKEPTALKPRNILQGCRSVFEYQKLSRINEGTYGVVYKARDKTTNEIVALKKVKMELGSDGFPMSSLREINILAVLHHSSIVNLKEVVMDDRDDCCGDVYVVMEYMERDVKGTIEAMKQPFSEEEVKCLMLQLLEGVNYLHDNWILHRDLKTSNLLLNNSGRLKICDFGLSRQYGIPSRPYTPLVVTLWYRAPELLLGTKQYSTAIDMWSVGCIMAEFLAKQPLFNGKTEVEQLDKIFRILGSPNETIWPGFSKLPGAKVKFVKQHRSRLPELFPAMSFFKGSPVLSEAGLDLLSQLLTYDPDKRMTAEDALKHRWFNVAEQELIRIQESLAKKLKSMLGIL